MEAAPRVPHRPGNILGGSAEWRGGQTAPPSLRDIANPALRPDTPAMSLPPGFLDELRARVSIGQVAGKKVLWDQKKSNPGKGDLWAPCPFHQEKTASFHVDDRKGFYYCFGCHAKGDAISFVKETENVGFMEAVESLAAEAGMAMPARDPGAQEKADRRSLLAEVMERAVRHYRLQLKTGAGAAARAYLEGRGLSEAALERWEIGFAPPGWQGLWDHLRSKGVAGDLIVDAGLARPSSQADKPPYDTFRDRIMFPIRDARGRAIAFGGRAMDPNDQAKYLNSPETALFDKGRSLYNHGPAREAAGQGRPLIVAEGYMDVIALAEAGFTGAVAPLGTAITEHQLQLLWRIAPEPIIALDGDAAGLRAARRLLDLALPLLTPDRTLRFVMLPEGQDPDDLLRSGGSAALGAAIEAAKPLIDMIWERELAKCAGTSPSDLVALETGLETATAAIGNPGLARKYANSLKYDFLIPYSKSLRRRKDTTAKTPRAGSALKSSLLVSGGETTVEALREAVILAVLTRHAGLVPEFEGELERMETTSPEAEAVRVALLSTGGAAAETIAEKAGQGALEKLLSTRHVAIQRAVRTDDEAAARFCLAEEFAKLFSRRAQAEIEREARDFGGAGDDARAWHVREIARAVDRAGRAASTDRADYDTGPNGARMRRDEKSAFEALLREIGIDGAAGE